MPAGAFKYWAFISYSHRDEAWAIWLQSALETYRIPRRLVGREGADGPLPRRLHPVFRDQEELSSGSSLSHAIDQALIASRYLIVIASPHAAASHWVEQEIQRFRALGRSDRILCLIVDGDPAPTDAARAAGILHCLPPALRQAPGQRDGNEPIAADVRPGREKPYSAKIRLIAGLIGVGFDELRRRDRIRQRLQTAGWVVGAAALITAFGLFGYQQRELRRAALAQQAQSVHLHRVIDNAREEMLKHRPARAAVYLAEAYRLGVDGPVLRYLLGRAMQYVDARRQVIDTGAPVQLIRFSHDQHRILALGENHRLQLWDVAGGRKLIEIAPGETHWYCQLSRDDRFIGCSVGEDFDRLRIWDAATGALRQEVPTKPDGAARVMFGSGLHSLASIGADLRPELRSLKSPASLLRLPIAVSAISFDRSGHKLLVGTETGEVSIWDAETGQVLRRFPKINEPIHWIDTSEDGGQIAAGSTRGALRIWDVADAGVRLSTSHTANPASVRFDQPGRNVLSEDYDGVRVWDTRNGALKFALRTNTSNSVESRLSPDGQLLYSSGLDELKANFVEAWSETYAVDGHLAAANDMDFSLDGQTLATCATDGRVILWNVPRLSVEFAHGTAHEATFSNDQIAGAAGVYSHDGRLIATASTDGAVRVWDAATHALLKQFDDIDPVSVDVLAFSRDDRMLAAGGDSGGIRLWSIPDFRPVRTLDTGGKGLLWIDFTEDRLVAAWTGHRSGIWRLSDGVLLGSWKRDFGPAQSMTPDGRAFAVGTDGTITLRRTEDAADLWRVKPGPSEQITALAFSHNGKVLAVADKAHHLMTLDPVDGRVLAQTSVPAGILIEGIDISGDGSIVAAADNNRNALLWWPASGRQVELKGHGSIVVSVGFSPDQQLLMTTSFDATARLWDVQTGDLVETIASMPQPFATPPFVGGHFSPDGRRLLTASADGVVREWDLPYEQRDPRTVAAHVACSAPWRLEGETLVPVLPPAGDCSASAADSGPR